MKSQNRNIYGIKKTLDRSGHSLPEDVLRVKRILSESGDYKTPEYGITAYPDQALFQSIKNFQKRHNLKIDGIVKPDGETIIAMATSPRYTCQLCGGFHGGVYSPNICHYCYNK